MKKPLHILLFFLLFVQACTAQPTFEELVSATAAKDTSEALRIASELEKSGVRSFGLYYNQGLAYRDSGQTARARASFEKALTYSPRDLGVRRRLREVKDRLSPQLVGKDTRQTPWWTAQESQVVLGLLALALVGCGGARCLRREIPKHQLGFLTGLFAVLFLLVYFNNPAPLRGVVVAPGTKLLTQPTGDSSGSVLFDGVLVNIVAEQGHFYEIEQKDGTRGWVRQAQVEPL